MGLIEASFIVLLSFFLLVMTCAMALQTWKDIAAYFKERREECEKQTRL